MRLLLLQISLFLVICYASESVETPGSKIIAEVDKHKKVPNQKPTLADEFARYRFDEEVRVGLRAAMCDARCDVTLGHLGLLGQCVMLAWEMAYLHGCSVPCLDVVALGCEVLDKKIRPPGLDGNDLCPDSQYNDFYSRYAEDNLGGGLFEEWYNKANGAKKAHQHAMLYIVVVVLATIENQN